MLEEKFLRPSGKGKGSGMEDNFHRPIDYLRISVTDRCNLRCRYCMPEEGVPLRKHAEILRLEEIALLARYAAELGIRKIRITGGEPLVRRDLPVLASRLRAIPEIEDLALTTNGQLLEGFATQLKEAGLDRVNISLDTMDPGRYRYITRGGDLARVFRGLEAARRSRLEPLKINVVVIRGFNDDEILSFVRLAREEALHVRFIELMPIGKGMTWGKEAFVSAAEVMDIIQKEFKLRLSSRVQGNGPARYYDLPDSLGTVGCISALSHSFCNRCNRMRLTAEGFLRPCLQSDQEVDLKTPLRAGWEPEEIRKLFVQALQIKPWSHSLDVEGWFRQQRRMSEIGG